MVILGVRIVHLLSDIIDWDSIWYFNYTDWVWIHGSSEWNVEPSYSPEYTPGGRAAFAYWIDNANNLYVFGGYKQPSLIMTFPEVILSKISTMMFGNLMDTIGTSLLEPQHLMIKVHTDNNFFQLNTLFLLQGHFPLLRTV